MRETRTWDACAQEFARGLLAEVDARAGGLLDTALPHGRMWLVVAAAGGLPVYNAPISTTLGELPKDADSRDDLLLDHGVFVASYNPRLKVASGYRGGSTPTISGRSTVRTTSALTKSCLLGSTR